MNQRVTMLTEQLNEASESLQKNLEQLQTETK
jgi:hypothetical protein